MARYGISKEGADALRQLAKDLKQITQEIEDSAQTLRSAVSGLGGDLGIYETQILDLIAQVKQAQVPGKAASDSLAALIKKKAEEIDALVSVGLA